MAQSIRTQSDFGQHDFALRSTGATSALGESAYTQDQLLLASDWRKSMAVKISPKFHSSQGDGHIDGGSVAAWGVTFHIDGDEFLHGSISIPVAGPSTRHEAQQKALKFLQVFLNNASEAAKLCQFAN
jgi:hypothetical protein